MTLSEHAHTHTAQDEAETIAIFRAFRDTGEIIALFPDLNHDNGSACYGHIMAYSHIGQHSEVEYNAVILATRPAQEEEYLDIAQELEGLGYRLRILKRKPNNL